MQAVQYYDVLTMSTTTTELATPLPALHPAPPRPSLHVSHTTTILPSPSHITPNRIKHAATAIIHEDVATIARDVLENLPMLCQPNNPLLETLQPPPVSDTVSDTAQVPTGPTTHAFTHRITVDHTASNRPITELIDFDLTLEPVSVSTDPTDPLTTTLTTTITFTTTPPLPSSSFDLAPVTGTLSITPRPHRTSLVTASFESTVEDEGGTPRTATWTARTPRIAKRTVRRTEGTQEKSATRAAGEQTMEGEKRKEQNTELTTEQTTEQTMEQTTEDAITTPPPTSMASRVTAAREMQASQQTLTNDPPVAATPAPKKKLTVADRIRWAAEVQPPAKLMVSDLNDDLNANWLFAGTTSTLSTGSRTGTKKGTARNPFSTMKNMTTKLLRPNKARTPATTSQLPSQRTATAILDHLLNLILVLHTKYARFDEVDKAMYVQERRE